MNNEAESPVNGEELYEHYRVVVDKGQSPLRIDKFLFSRLVNVSRNRVQLAAAAGSIRVNGKPVKSNYRVKPEDVISVVMAQPPRDTALYADEIELDIVYEDETLVVVNKPAGMVVHPAYGNYRGTLVNALACHFNPALKNQPVESDSLRPGLVHRIDKNTSGLLVVAKEEKAMTHLARQFYDRQIDRNYVALAWGDFGEEEGTVTGHIGRSLVNRKVMDVYPDGSHGKHAVTHYKVMERFHYTTLVSCRLETGRTHQIRAHFSHINHPLFNDAEYGGDRLVKGPSFSKYKQFIANCFSACPRQALHAESLGFVHPATGKKVFFTVQLPGDLQELIAKWRSYAADAP